MLLARIAAGLMLFLGPGIAGCQEERDRIIHVDEDDAAMKAAISSARDKLPYFWKTRENPGPGEESFTLKVQLEDKNGIEYFWCGKIQRDGEKITAVIDNDPQTVEHVKLGQRIEVPEADIADWLFMRNGKMVGNYTLRPLLKSMTPQEKQMLEGRLAPLP